MERTSEEQDLALRCAARDGAAWDELLSGAGPLCESVIRRVFRRAGIPGADREAADAMGAWALALLERDGAILRAFDPARAPLPAYLAVVARSVAIRMLTKRRLHAPLEDHDAPERPLEEAGVEDPDRLWQALERLEPRQRLLLKLTYWDGLDAGEAARALGVKPSSIGQLLSRARTALKEKLAP